MAEPFLAEIRMMSFNFPPKGWALANGQLLPINQNQALFALLGTTFGGNGQTNFALPNMRGRTPIHVGSGFTLGQQGGRRPIHLHWPNCRHITMWSMEPMQWAIRLYQAPMHCWQAVHLRSNLRVRKASAPPILRR